MVNAAGVNASILYRSHMVNQGMKPKIRRRFVKELALEMIRPWAENRLEQPTLPLGFIDAVKMAFPQLAIISRPPVPVQLPKPKRCRICPHSRDRKTKQICSKCHQPVCKDHATLVRICTDCHPAGKTSCKLSCTAWHLCIFLFMLIANNRVWFIEKTYKHCCVFYSQKTFFINYLLLSAERCV